MPAKNLSRNNDDGAFLHVYNRGIDDRIIFTDDEDIKVFLDYLKDYLGPPRDKESTKQEFEVKGRKFKGTPHLPKNYFNQVELIAYNLLPNHFHLVLHQLSKGSVEKFLRSLSTRYSIYFNKKHKRAGTLFVGPYKSTSLNESHLTNLAGYLHLSNGSSSHGNYLGLQDSPWVNPEVIMATFNHDQALYKKFINEFKVEQIADLKDISLETEFDKVTSKLKKEAESQFKSYSMIPEFLAASAAVFMLLLILGIRNVYTATTVNNTARPPNPNAVLSAQTVSPTSPPEATPSSAVNFDPQSQVIETITVSIDKNNILNVRQNPSLTSKKVARVKNGDILEVVSIDKDWFEVKVASQSGFISAKFVKGPPSMFERRDLIIHE